MKYFLYHEGKNIPEHVLLCVKNILKLNSSTKIIFCTNLNIKFTEQNIDVVNINDLNIRQILNFHKRDPNPLWYTSLNRVFYLNSYVQTTKEPTIHFDNDVLCYYDFSLIEHNYKDELYITPHKDTEYTFGFSYIGNYNKMNELTNKIYDLIEHGEIHTKQHTGDHAHEMRLLGYCGEGIIKQFNVFPTTKEVQFIFDPSSYGQHLDGTPNGEKPGYIDTTHVVGSKLTSTDVIYFEKKPFLIHNDTTYPIFNLHIHSKNLQKYSL